MTSHCCHFLSFHVSGKYQFARVRDLNCGTTKQGQLDSSSLSTRALKDCHASSTWLYPFSSVVTPVFLPKMPQLQHANECLIAPAQVVHTESRCGMGTSRSPYVIPAADHRADVKPMSRCHLSTCM